MATVEAKVFSSDEARLVKLEGCRGFASQQECIGRIRDRCFAWRPKSVAGKPLAKSKSDLGKLDAAKV